MALRERGQFGAVHGGLSPEFGGAEGEPVLIQDVKPPTAGGQHPARMARGLGSQRLAEPAADPGQGRTAPPGPGRRDQMTVGVVPAAEVQRDSPGQQVRLRRVAGAEGIQPGGRPDGLAQQSGDTGPTW